MSIASYKGVAPSAVRVVSAVLSAAVLIRASVASADGGPTSRDSAFTEAKLAVARGERGPELGLVGVGGLVEVDVHEHADWAAFRASPHAPRRLWLFTTKAEQNFWSVQYADGDGLVFGNEGSGAPDWLHEELRASRVTIPHANDSLRSLNLSTAAGVATYEALRQESVGGFAAALRGEP